jgi:hypothetical membrane protein
MKSLVLAATLWGLGGLVYIAAETIAARAFPGYRYGFNYISDLGVPIPETFDGRLINSPLSWVMNAGFIGEGLLYFLAALCAFQFLPAGKARVTLLALGLAHGVGMTLVGTFHGAQQTAENGTGVLHALGAVIAIVGGNSVSVCVGIAGFRYGLPKALCRISIALGTIGLVSLAMWLANRLVGPIVFADAVWERGSVYSITVWELYLSADILRRALRGNLTVVP